MPMLPDSLRRSPKPVYLVASDEPLLLRDWLDQARAALAEQGFEDIHSHQIESGFDWDGLLQDGQNLSLFSARKALIIRFNGPRPGTSGGRFISQVCENPDADTLYVLAMPKLDTAARNSAWMKKIKQAGEFCELAPVYIDKLAGWIAERAAAKGVILDHQAAMYLADLTEGNLLATDQELEKLALTNEPGLAISFEQLADSIARSARYSQYLLVDACLAGKAQRAVKILRGLRQEGLQPVQLIFPIQQALENLLELKQHQRADRLDRDVWQSLRIWASKQKLYGSALNRLSLDRIERLLRNCAKLDRLNKGRQVGAQGGDDWLAIQHLVNRLSGLENEENTMP